MSHGPDRGELCYALTVCRVIPWLDLLSFSSSEKLSVPRVAMSFLVTCRGGGTYQEHQGGPINIQQCIYISFPMWAML